MTDNLEEIRKRVEDVNAYLAYRLNLGLYASSEKPMSREEWIEHVNSDEYKYEQWLFKNTHEPEYECTCFHDDE